MTVDVLATQPNYVDHIAPIWHALGPDERGTFYVAGAVADSADRWGLPGWQPGYPTGDGPPVLVAGYADEAACGTRQVIYLEHGAGQTYGGDPDPNVHDHPAYSGTPGHDRAGLFLCPGDTVADRWRARYPTVPAVAVGCPKLDPWHDGRAARNPFTPATVAITFHSDNRLCPESISAWRHYQADGARIVADLRAEGWQVLGHAHPRIWRHLSHWWAQAGAETVESYGEVLARADVLVADNTSALYEFASTGRPVACLNAPWYRKDIHHGLRFWNLVPGPQADDSGGILPAIREAATPEWGRRRADVVSEVYCATDGGATGRAVDAIRRHLPGPPPSAYARRR